MYIDRKPTLFVWPIQLPSSLFSWEKMRPYITTELRCCRKFDDWQQRQLLAYLRGYFRGGGSKLASHFFSLAVRQLRNVFVESTDYSAVDIDGGDIETVASFNLIELGDMSSQVFVVLTQYRQKMMLNQDATDIRRWLTQSNDEQVPVNEFYKFINTTDRYLTSSKGLKQLETELLCWLAIEWLQELDLSEGLIEL